MVFFHTYLGTLQDFTHHLGMISLTFTIIYGFRSLVEVIMKFTQIYVYIYIHISYG